MKKVWVFSSETDKNIKIGMRRKKWAYNKSTKTHGGIDIGDYILLYSKESQMIMCVGMIKTLPKIGKPISIWGSEHWDSFSFDIKRKKPIHINDIKNKFNIDDMSKFGKLLFSNAASDFTARQALQIIKM